MMNECRESDSLIVSVKSSNKICDNKHMAEKMEKRRLISIKASARYYLRQEPSAVVPHAWDLCGGCRVTGIPTATAVDPFSN
jgi:hypothetical protein